MVDEFKMKLYVNISKIPGVVISLEFNNDSFPPTFTGHMFAIRKNV